jgi:hypothetical protein
MGCSVISTDYYRLFHHLNHYHPNNLMLMNLQDFNYTPKDIYSIYRVFRHVCKGSPGAAVEITKILTHLDLDYFPFFVKLFSVFDENNTGKLNFYEFAITLWMICTSDEQTLGSLLPSSFVLSDFVLSSLTFVL